MLELGPWGVKFEIHEPCDERLDTMPALPGGRFCTSCQTVVIDLSRVTRAQAEQRMKAVVGDRACVQLRVDRFNDAVFLPPPKRAPHWSRGVVLLAALTAGGCTLDEPAEPIPVVTVAPEPGPPMMPSVAAIAPATAPGPAISTRAVPAGELNSESNTAVRPTAQQRALTAAKRRPMHTIRAGGMHFARPPTPTAF